MSVLGMGSECLQAVPLLPGNREAIDVAQLDARLAALDGHPAIAALKERYDFWLHVDAAFGGFAALSPRYARLTAALDSADSISIDLHKWLNVPYDAAVQFTRRQDLRVRVFHKASPYLGMPVGDPDFLHLTPENSRRLRALSAWFSLTAYGRDGHGEIVERNIALAQELGIRIAAVPHLRLLAPVRLNVVCFTLADDPAQDSIDAAARAIAASGEVFATPTVYASQPALRAAFSNWRTSKADTQRILDAVVQATATVVDGPQC